MGAEAEGAHAHHHPSLSLRTLAHYTNNGSASSSSIDATAHDTKHSKFHHHKSQKETNQAAVRAARAEVRSKVREDWEFPVPQSVPLAFAIDDESIRWVERVSDDEAQTVTANTDDERPEWDNPDPFGTQQSVAASKKRKRRERLRDELEWNAGLRHWTERRDVWTAAHTRPFNSRLADSPSTSSIRAQSPTRDSIQIPENAATDEQHFLTVPLPGSTAQRSGSSGTSASDLTTGDHDATTPTTQTPHTSSETLNIPSKPIPSPALPEDPALPAAVEIPLPDSPSPTTTTSNLPHPAPEPLTSTLLPIPPPLLPPSNPIRLSISPANYPPLYTKLVLQSQRPTVPIPLSHILPMLVGGWKRDGEWPPKSEAEKALGTGKKGNGWEEKGEGVWSYGGGRGRVRRSVGKVKRVLGLGVGHDGPDAEETGMVDLGVEGEGIVEG